MTEPCKSIKEGERAGVGKLISNYITLLRQVVGSWTPKWSKRHVHTDEVTAAGIYIKLFTITTTTASIYLRFSSTFWTDFLIISSKMKLCAVLRINIGYIERVYAT